MNEEKNGVNPGNATVQVEPAQTPGKTVTERVVERDGGQMVDGETRRWMAKHNLASRTFYAFGYLTSAVRQMADGRLSADDVARMSAELQDLVGIEGVDE